MRPNGRHAAAILVFTMLPVATMAQDCVKNLKARTQAASRDVAFGILADCIVEQARIIEAQSNPIPDDAILLSTTNCSDFGWETLEESLGRTVLGAGAVSTFDPGDAYRFYELTKPDGTVVREKLRPYKGEPYQPMEAGGAETVALTLGQMPRHDHEVLWAEKHSISLNDTRGDVPGDNQYRLEWIGNKGWAGNNMTAVWKGGNQPHNNMPPYIALYFCKKD